MTIDKELVQILRTELQAAVTKVCARHGLNAEQQKNITYNSDSFNIRFTISNGEIDLNQKEFNGVCFTMGLRPEHYGETFAIRGKVYTITGINTRARRYPINATCEDGKPFKFEALAVKDALRRDDKL